MTDRFRPRNLAILAAATAASIGSPASAEMDPSSRIELSIESVVDDVAPPLAAGARLAIETSFTDRTVILNLTATESVAPGYVQVYDSEENITLTSNLNLDAVDQTRPNLVFAKVGADGKANAYTMAGLHLITDEQGAIVDGNFEDVPDERLIDTRKLNKEALPAGSFTEIVGKPNSTAVVNLTVTEATAAGFLQTVDSRSSPELGKSSNHNYGRGETKARLNLIRFNDDGKTYIFNSASAHIVVDLQGYFTEDAIDDIVDTRVLDTRNAEFGAKKVEAGSVTIIKGKPNSTAIVNIVGTENEAPGFIQGMSAGQTGGETSNTNLNNVDSTEGSMAFLPFDENGEARIFAMMETHLVVDVLAYMKQGAFEDTPDKRLKDTRNVVANSDGTIVVYQQSGPLPLAAEQMDGYCEVIYWLSGGSTIFYEIKVSELRADTDPTYINNGEKVHVTYETLGNNDQPFRFDYTRQANTEGNIYISANIESKKLLREVDIPELRLTRGVGGSAESLAVASVDMTCIPV